MYSFSNYINVFPGNDEFTYETFYELTKETLKFLIKHE